MKRRKLIQSAALGSASFAVNLSLLNPQPPESSFASMNEKQRFDWIFLYWMPYDNNLSRFGEPILEMLAKGVRSENILVAVESDFWGAKNLSRRAIAKDRVEVEQLETANSASEEVFVEYLNWANSRFVADKWAIVFLGHGGRLDEISPDEDTGTAQSGTQWMNIKKLSDVIQEFNKKIGKPVELLFLQNCNKATIEVHYTLREAARYTLASQKLLGAPNYYYEQVLQFLGSNPGVNGGQLAEKIMEFERPDMYSSYTVTENRYLRELPARLNPLIDEILSSLSSKRLAISRSELKPYLYWDELFVDAVFLLKELTKRSGCAENRCDDFVGLLQTSVIYRYQQNPQQLNPNLSGLGLLLPRSKGQLEQYQYLPAFSDLKLAELFEAIL
ncbi:MAG: clostripain family protease [Oscillatoria princeps RMCB-10]|jgi:hypothetical protein|nr:clostripain family protease [Oscillatoria princeps RMCB-10]